MWQSDHPPGPYDMALHADDLAALMDALDISEAHIGGTSYGAEIGMVYAVKYPERTKTLIVTSAVSHIDPILRGFIDVWIAAARAEDPELFYRSVYPLTFSEGWIAANQPLLDQARQRYKKIDYEAMLALLLSFLELDIRDQLGRISAPTLVAVGELDILKPRRYSEIIANEIPGAELALIPGAGHAALWEQAGVFNTLILGFLAKHRGQ
jgi:3-oxoadipate enol-lactonase